MLMPIPLKLSMRLFFTSTEEACRTSPLLRHPEKWLSRITVPTPPRPSCGKMISGNSSFRNPLCISCSCRAEYFFSRPA